MYAGLEMEANLTNLIGCSSFLVAAHKLVLCFYLNWLQIIAVIFCSIKATAVVTSKSVNWFLCNGNFDTLIAYCCF